MKIKTDFVTNSSTTSFVVIGINLDVLDVPDDYLKDIAKERDKTIGEVRSDPYDFVNSLIEGSDLEYAMPEHYDHCMVGIEYSDMRDDETLKEFKERVELQLLECFGITKKPHHIEEAWRDG